MTIKEDLVREAIVTFLKSSPLLTGQDKEYELSLGGADSGTFTLLQGVAETDPLSWDISPQDLQSALQGLYGTGRVTVGLVESGFSISLKADAAMEADFSNLDEYAEPSLTIVQEFIHGYLGARIFPGVLPSNLTLYPAAAVDRIFTDRKRWKLGLTGITESRINIAVIGNRKLDVNRASDAIESVLNDFHRGSMEGLQVKSISLEEQADLYDQNVDLYQVSSDYMVTHENEI